MLQFSVSKNSPIHGGGHNESHYVVLISAQSSETRKSTSHKDLFLSVAAFMLHKKASKLKNNVVVCDSEETGSSVGRVS